MDVNRDGYLDVLIGNDHLRETRVWLPQTRSWAVLGFPTKLANPADEVPDVGVRFGVVAPAGEVIAFRRSYVDGYHKQTVDAMWRFNGERWVEDDELKNGLPDDFLTRGFVGDRGVRLRDIDGDGGCELIVPDPVAQTNAVYGWDAGGKTWCKFPFSLPAGTYVVDTMGRDAGLRFVDADGDGKLDVLYSDEKTCSLHLFKSMQEGWSREVKVTSRGEKGEIPIIVRDGKDNGGVARTCAACGSRTNTPPACPTAWTGCRLRTCWPATATAVAGGDVSRA